MTAVVLKGGSGFGYDPRAPKLAISCMKSSYFLSKPPEPSTGADLCEGILAKTAGAALGAAFVTFKEVKSPPSFGAADGARGKPVFLGLAVAAASRRTRSDAGTMDVTFLS